MDPFNASKALDKVLTERFQNNPVTIDDAGNRYLVTGCNSGQFNVTAIGPDGETLAGGLQQLPVDEHYLGLVIDQIGTTTNATAAPGGGGTGAGGTAHAAGAAQS